MHNIRTEDRIVYQWNAPDLVYSKIHKKNWKEKIPTISIYQGNIVYDQKLFALHKIKNQYCWLDDSNDHELIGILIPQRQGTQFRIIMKKNDAIITMYASVNLTYAFEVENKETHHKNQFSVKYGYVEKGDYVLDEFTVYHHIDGDKKELPNVRAKMITITKEEHTFLGMDIQFKEKIDEIGRLRLQFDNTHQLADIIGWKSSMALCKANPEYEGNANSDSPTLSQIQQLIQKQSPRNAKLSKASIDLITAQIDGMLAEEPLSVEALYAVPQPVHFVNISKVIQSTIIDLALALAPNFVIDFLSVGRPPIDKKYTEIMEDSDVKEFLSRFMKMYMNDRWANDKNLLYSEYVREVENYENKITYYWNGDGETCMCLDPGYLKLIDVVEVKTYFAGILEIEPFLKDREKWNKELYKFLQLPEVSMEITVELEQGEMSKSGHMDYIFKYLSHQNITTIDKQNCCCDSADKKNAPECNADTAYRHILLNRQLNDSLLFLEGKDYQVEVDKMYQVSAFIAEKMQRKQTVKIDQNIVKLAVDSFLETVNNEPMSNCGICLYKALRQFDDPLVKKVLFLTAIAMWNDSFTKSYQYERSTTEINVGVYQCMYDGMESIISKEPNLYHKIFDNHATSNDIFAATEHIASLFFYTQAVDPSYYQMDVLRQVNKQRYTNKSNFKGSIITDFIMIFVDAFSFALDLAVLSKDNIAWEHAVEVMEDISTIVAGIGIMINVLDIGIAIEFTEITVSWIPVAGAVLAVLGICCSIITWIIALLSPTKMELYAKEDCVDFLKNLNDPSQEWIDDFNERMKNFLQRVQNKKQLVFS